MANFGNQGGRKANQPAVPGQSLIPGAAMEIVEPKCKVCMSPHRREIDMLLATGGWSDTAIANHFNNFLGDGFFSKHSIGRHKKRHLSVRDAAVRNIIEARARQFGVDVEEVEGSILTKAAVLDTIIATGIDSLHRGDTVVEARDVLAAVATLDKFESEWKETAIDELLAEFKLFMEAVKSHVPEELYAAIYETFEAKLDARSGPTLKPLPPAPTEEIGEVTEESFED